MLHATNMSCVLFTRFLSRSIIYPNEREREREREFNGIVFGIFDKLEEYEVPVTNK